MNIEHWTLIPPWWLWEQHHWMWAYRKFTFSKIVELDTNIYIHFVVHSFSLLWIYLCTTTIWTHFSSSLAFCLCHRCKMRIFVECRTAHMTWWIIIIHLYNSRIIEHYVGMIIWIPKSKCQWFWFNFEFWFVS